VLNSLLILLARDGGRAVSQIARISPRQCSRDEDLDSFGPAASVRMTARSPLAATEGLEIDASF